MDGLLLDYECVLTRCRMDKDEEQPHARESRGLWTLWGLLHPGLVRAHQRPLVQGADTLQVTLSDALPVFAAPVVSGSRNAAAAASPHDWSRHDDWVQRRDTREYRHRHDPRLRERRHEHR